MSSVDQTRGGGGGARGGVITGCRRELLPNNYQLLSPEDENNLYLYPALEHVVLYTVHKGKYRHLLLVVSEFNIMKGMCDFLNL